jgi:hypothetical protein
VIQQKQIVDLPLKTRQILQLSLLNEGVVNPPGGTSGDSLQQTGTLINVLGQRTGHTLFLLNGTNIADEYYNNECARPAHAAVRTEAQILKEREDDEDRPTDIHVGIDATFFARW